MYLETEAEIWGSKREYKYSLYHSDYTMAMKTSSPLQVESVCMRECLEMLMC